MVAGTADGPDPFDPFVLPGIQQGEPLFGARVDHVFLIVGITYFQIAGRDIDLHNRAPVQLGDLVDDSLPVNGSAHVGPEQIIRVFPVQGERVPAGEVFRQQGRLLSFSFRHYFFLGSN